MGDKPVHPTLEYSFGTVGRSAEQHVYRVIFVRYASPFWFALLPPAGPMDTFRHLHPHADGATHELYWPWGRPLRRHRLDYLFLRPDHRSWQVLEARHLHAPGEGPHSDHGAVLARLAAGRFDS